MSFVGNLLEKFHEKVEKASSHALTNELCDGSLPDFKLYTYLVQDLKYFQDGLNMFGNALTHCDKPDSAIVLGKQIGFLANDENTYFHRSLAQIKQESKSDLELRVPAMLEKVPPALPEVQQYLQFLNYLAHEAKSYGEIVISIYVMEVVYLKWAEKHLKRDRAIVEALQYKHKEWVDLHSGEAFSAWVEFLAGEVERAALISDQQEKMEELFEKTLDLEISFFDACYKYGDN